MKKILLTASFALLVSACASTQTSMDSTMDAASAITAAKAENAKAAAVGYSWRDTGKMIAAAEKALKEKDEAKATSLAMKAKRQAENALKQHAEQMKAVTQY